MVDHLETLIFQNTASRVKTNRYIVSMREIHGTKHDDFVTADWMEITNNGDLRFITGNLTVRAYASGYWIKVEKEPLR